jgi:hypothetical protein
MKRAMFTAMLVAALSLVGTSQAAAPLTKQVGKDALNVFTPICAVPGYADYGLCGGDTTMFAGVEGKINAIQKDPGVYSLDFSFKNLTPGVEYKLISTYDAVPFGGTWTEVGRMFADAAGSVTYQLQTSVPAGLGFDLNRVGGDVTIVTSWWSGDKLVVNPDGTLAAAA